MSEGACYIRSVADHAPLSGSVAAGLIAGLAGTLVVSAWEALTVGGSFAEVFVASAGLFAPVGLALGAALGVIGHAWRAQFGERSIARFYRRLGSDRDAEARAVGAVIAAVVAAALLAALVFAGALKLVASVERKGAGAILLAVLVAGALPVIAVAALPAYRAGVRLAALVPRLGPVPKPVVLVVAGAAIAVAGVLLTIVSRLDWRALPLGLPICLAVLAVVTAAGFVAVRRLLADKAVAVLAAGVASAAVSLALFFFGLSPGADTARAIVDRGRGAPALVAIGRALSDGDGDGVSAFFAGPDCDDGNPDVHPNAREIPGNGVDDNCLGGDRAAAPEPASGDSSDTAAPEVTLPTVKNVLLVVIDTLRADRLGAAGYRRDGKSLTPNLDALIGRSSYFTRVWAQAPNTPRSFPSMFTSRYPSQVVVHKQFHNYSNVLPENTTIFEIAAAAGIQTIGFSSHFYFSEERGIRQGFASYNNDGAKDIAGSNKDIASPRVVPLATARLAELARSGERFAMFVHLFEPHSTYLAHDDWPITEKGTAGLEQKYDYEIAFVDRWVGKLLDGLAGAGLADDTLVIIASDHGEAFGVHRFAGKRMFFHGQTLYDELLRVPLIIRAPNGEARRIDRPSMLVDLAPTIADALGLEPDPKFVGRSLWPAVWGETIAPRPVYAQLMPAPSWKHEAVMTVDAAGTDKVIYRVSEGAWEIFDLEADPEERSDLSRENPDKLAQMKEKLAHFLEVELPGDAP